MAAPNAQNPWSTPEECLSHVQKTLSLAFIGITGSASLAVLVCAITVHSTLLLGGPRLLLRIMTSTLVVVHGIVCIGGAILAIIFICHAFRNRALTTRSRLLWLPVLACGYGLIFYWYRHIRLKRSLN